MGGPRPTEKETTPKIGEYRFRAGTVYSQLSAPNTEVSGSLPQRELRRNIDRICLLASRLKLIWGTRLPPGGGYVLGHHVYVAWELSRNSFLSQRLCREAPLCRLAQIQLR